MLNTVSSTYLSFVHFLWRNVYLGPLLIFFWGLFVFLAIELREFLIYFGYYLTVWYVVCKYYLLFHGILFRFVDAFLYSAGGFSSEGVLLVYFFAFVGFVFGVKPKISLLLFSRSVMSSSLRLCRLQNTRLPCPSLSPRVWSNSSPLSQWCHPTISSSVTPFFSCPQSFPASGSFQISWIFTSGGQSIGVSASASVLSMNIQDCFPLGWTGLISIQSKELSRVFSTNTVQKHQFFGAQPPLWSNSHIQTWLLEKP